jgi:hypothetical protein
VELALDGTVVQAVASLAKMLKLEAARALLEQAQEAAAHTPQDPEVPERLAWAQRVAQMAQERAAARKDKGREAEETRVSPTELETALQPLKNAGGKAFIQACDPGQCSADHRRTRCGALQRNAASGEKTLKSFDERLGGFEPVLAGLWGRQEVASRSALSRFLEAVTPEALEKLRQISFEDLLRRGVEQERWGGLLDRLGQRHVVFDMDGTKQVARQRSAVQTAEYPPLGRRLEPLCAPGYVGRNRGEVVRTRTAVQQAHTQEWLGTFGGAGNGQLYAELGRDCEAARAYLEAQHLPSSVALVRLEGLYGYVPASVS